MILLPSRDEVVDHLAGLRALGHVLLVTSSAAWSPGARRRTCGRRRGPAVQPASSVGADVDPGRLDRLAAARRSSRSCGPELLSDVVPHPVATAIAATSTGTSATKRLVIGLLEPVRLFPSRRANRAPWTDPCSLCLKIRTFSFATTVSQASGSVPPRMPERLIIEGCAIATVDDERREHADGHLVLEDGRIAAVGAGRRAPTPTAAPVDGARPAGHARARQLPPPPLPVGHARLRAARRRCSSGSSRSTRSGRTSTTRRSTRPRGRRSRRWRGRAARRRPTTTTSSPTTPATCWRSRSRRRARPGCASTPAAARWTSASPTAACRPTASSRTATRSSSASAAAIDRHHDPSPGRDGADRARADLAVLGHRAS